LAAAAPADKKPVDKNDDKKTDEKKPVEKPTDDKKDKERKGLQWPLPDPDNEGDLMLHGSQLMDRVEELHKGKVEKEEDKMILSVGRDYLRRVHKYIEKATDFKILPVLCKDSEHLNSTTRWVIRSLPKNHQSFLDWFQSVFASRSFSTDEEPEKQSAQGEQGTKGTKQQQDATQSKGAKQQNDSVAQSDSEHENVTENATENVNTTEIAHGNNNNGTKERPNFEKINKEFYKSMGDNFARMLMKRYRKEKMDKEETEYLNRWNSDEAVHYGFMGIYCHDGENLKDLIKRISTLIDEKQ